MAGRSSFLLPGDEVRVERRYVVDGGLTGVVDEGRFAGVQLLGTTEHIVLEVAGSTRTIPLSSISEIRLLGPPRRTDLGYDPSVA
jgi:hypothetical protein